MEKPQAKYKLRSTSYFVHLIAFLAIAVAVTVAIFVPESSSHQKAETWKLVLFVLFMFYAVYTYLAMPRTIEVHPDGLLKFRSYLGDRTLPIDDLRIIKTDMMGYYVIFHFGTRKFKILNRIDGLYELCSYLKTKKSGLLIKGL